MVVICATCFLTRKVFFLFCPHAHNAATVEYETTAFIRNVENHSLRGAKPHPGLMENSYAPTISNRFLFRKYVTVQPLCAQYVEHCSLSQVCWCDVFQVGFVSIPSSLVVTAVTNFTIFRLVHIFAKSTYFMHNVRLFVCLRVWPSVCMYKHGSHWTKLREIWYGDCYETLSWNSKFC